MNNKFFQRSQVIPILSLIMGVTSVSASDFQLKEREGDRDRGFPQMAISEMTGSPRIAVQSTGNIAFDQRMRGVQAVSAQTFNMLMEADDARNHYCRSMNKATQEYVPILEQRIDYARREINTVMNTIRERQTDIAKARNEWNRLAKITKKCSQSFFGITLKSSSHDEIPVYEGSERDKFSIQAMVDGLPRLMENLNNLHGVITEYVREKTRIILSIEAQRGTILSIADISKLNSAAAEIENRTRNAQSELPSIEDSSAGAGGSSSLPADLL